MQTCVLCIVKTKVELSEEMELRGLLQVRKYFQLPNMQQYNSAMKPMDSSSQVQGMVYKKKIIDFEKVPTVVQMKQDPVNAMFLNCLCSSIILENSRVYFPFLSTDCLQWSSIPMMLGSVFLDVAVIRHDRTILRDNVCFPKIKTKTWSLVLSASKL